MDGKTVKTQILLFMLTFALLACAMPGFTRPLLEDTPPAKAPDSGLFSRKGNKRPPRPLPVNRPVQITFEADPVIYAAISGDGGRLVYTMESRGPSSLWLRALDPSRMDLPKKVVEGPGKISAPALSRDGRRIAFVATGYDAKGDIYFMTPDAEKASPKRLTGRETEDGAPCFSPDGNILYFHRSRPGETLRQLATLDLRQDLPRPRPLETGGDAAFPAISPDGQRCAFVSVRADPGGDIFVMDLKTGRVDPVTRGPARDLYPCWSGDGHTLYFSRFGVDTNRDGKVTLDDNAVICRVPAAGPGPLIYPLTSETFSAYQPIITPAGLSFLSTLKRTSNLWSLPPGGQIPPMQDARKQMDLAETLNSHVPRDDSLTILAFYKVLEGFSGEGSYGGKAAYRIGRLYERMGRTEQAGQAYAQVVQTFENTFPEASLARIRLEGIRTRTRWKEAPTDLKRRDILDEALTRIATLAKADILPGTDVDYAGLTIIRARSLMEQARLLTDLGRDPQSLLKAIQLLDRVAETPGIPASLLAEAMFVKARLNSRIGRAGEVVPAYLKIIKGFPNTEWADRSVEQIIDKTLSEPNRETGEDKIQALARLAQTYKNAVPKLAMGALNRMGDISYEAGEWKQAKSWYRQVVNQYSQAAGQTAGEISTQAAAARLALAEILYREELFREALDLYEAGMAMQPYEDHLYRLTRAAYIQKSLAAADFLYHLGEVPAAQNLYADLIREDRTRVQAHRGYIRCAAARKQMEPTLTLYRKQLEKAPNDPVNLYTTGLCLTYLEGKDPLNEARSLIQKAIQRQGQVAYFHQTLGYIFEVMETVYHQPGYLEKALECYQKAYFLNNAELDPENTADLALNLGNISFLLGQYSKALESYLERLESNTPFDHEDTEILFFRRLGAAAFQVRDPDRPVEAYSRALALIEKRIDQKRASEILGKINTTIFDRILTPALKRPDAAKKAEALVQRQSGINRRLFDSTGRTFGPPPDPQWAVYKTAMESIIADQEKVLGEIGPLVVEKKEETDQTLGFMLTRAREALKFPEEMVQLKAEMLDRLGLAYQEAGQWTQAGAAFERAFQLNQKLGRFQNLAANRRSTAYNAYMEAGVLSGAARTKMLETATKGFQAVGPLVDRYGVATSKASKGPSDRPAQAILDVSLDLSLDKTASSQAMYGFSPEQEKRLAQAFISRIETELGDLEKAQKAIERQIGPYPSGRTIPDEDLYGVALLSHRDGHLKYARRDLKKAFQGFLRSARLSLRLKNPVSAALNVENMAWTLSRIPARDPDFGKDRAHLLALDREATRLLERFSDVLDPLLVPSYHNTMGVLILKNKPEQGQGYLEAAVQEMDGVEAAGAHFFSGLKSLQKHKGPKGRKALGLEAALHLNMASVAGRLKEPETAKSHLEKALEISRKGLLPQYEWRALTGLGNLKDALPVLESVPLLEAGCGANEILDAFAPLVSDLIAKGKTEDAFNLLERISEMERFQRLTPLALGGLSPPEQQWLLRVLPRLLILEQLRGDLKSADKTERPHLLRRIDQELHLLQSAMGDDGAQIPVSARLTKSKAGQHQVLMMLGLALKARQLGDKAVETGAGAEADALKQQYSELLRSYRSMWKKMRARAAKEDNPGISAIFAPDPVEAIDLMESLPGGSTAIRLFRSRDPGQAWQAFMVTPEEITVRSLEKEAPLPIMKHGPAILIFEDPSSLPFPVTPPLALSATHLVRSIRNQKPFKKKTLAVSAEYSLPSAFEVVSLPSSIHQADLLEALPGIQGLLLGGPVYMASSVPTRPGQVPFQYPAMGLDQGRSVPLTSLFDEVSDASLALLPGASVEDAYPLAHLFSLMGVPTLMLPRQPLTRSTFVEPFFRAYAASPSHEALLTAGSQQGGREEWIGFGARGMTTDEALSLAKKRFKSYVTEGAKAYKNQEPLHALIFFQKALTVADQVQEFERYLPQLEQYARESAYAAGRYEEAQHHARALVERLAKKKPDSKEYAEALISLGLVQARMERYDRAIAALEEGAEIMASLELGARQVEALNDLGVVLENATDYDRALAQFQSAAALSKTLNKQELLAHQHMRMGRIYDLRLSQYAKAKQHYMEAYKLYETLAEKENMAQALLDTGRCNRLLGNFKEAGEQYKKALALSGMGEKNQRLRANITMEQANNDWFQARYQDAFKHQRDVYQKARENQWALEQVNALNTSGLIWWTLGDHPRALRQLEEALDQAKTLKARKDERATTLNNMGLVYRDMGQYEKALKALDEALRIDREINSRWAIAYDLKNQALTYLHMGKAEQALPLFQEALTTAAQIGNRINQAKILAGYGEALAALGRFPEANDVFKQALDLSRAMALRETEWRSLYGLAQLRLKQGDREKAGELLSQAVEVIESMRADIKLDQLRDGFISNKMDVYEALVSLLVDMGKTSEAFYVAERSRARNLIDLLGNQRLSLYGVVNQELYDKEKTLRARISEGEILLAQAREKEERAVYEREVKRANDEYRDLMLEIQMKNPELGSILSVNPLTLPQVQELLEPGVAMLAYYVVPDQILCWLITRENVDLFRTPLGRKTLRETILDYRRALQNLEPQESQSRQLYEWLVSRSGARLEGVKVLGIIPHDTLHHLSFATLFNGKDHLVDSFSLFSLPSASVLRYTHQRRQKEKNLRVLAVGNPDLKNPGLDLPFAEKEVSSIGWNFPETTVLTGEKATEGWVVRNISKFGIIHLASHGEFDPINPLFSAVKLARDDTDDGDLQASEVFGLDIKAGLVVLSACQTGLGKITGGDDVIGMNRAFLYAGTHAIISSLWRVSDISTAILVKQFYREYKAKPLADSLRRAMLHVKTRYPHPGYWGAFVLVGDYQ
ncbi:MAG: tetratricopeptide repeat protein [Desulfobacteraceae bacterium]|nr:tetratricopeptide repeat protein [Desulfobacteraceae bacterium]